MKIYSRTIFWRFGLIGNFLFNHFSNHPNWNKKWFVFKLFSIGFFLFANGFFALLAIMIARRSLGWFLFLPITALLSTLYGLWAESFFEKSDSASI